MTAGLDMLSFRFVVRFMLEFMKAGAMVHGGDYERGLVFLLVFHANVEHISADEALDVAYAWTVAPDEVRRPISAQALAMELGLPRETVRRRVNELIERGALVRIGQKGGLIVPTAFFARPGMLLTQFEIFESFFKVLRRLRAIGFDWPDPTPGHRQAFDRAGEAPLPLSVVGRQVMTFALRIVTLSIRSLGGLERNMVLAVVEDANVAPYADDRALSWRYGVERPEPAPNDLKAPISVVEVSRTLGLSLSTTHRLVRGLVAGGLLMRVKGGLIVPAAVAMDGDVARWRGAVHGHLMSSWTRLIDLGFREEDMAVWSSIHADLVKIQAEGASVAG